MIAVLAPGVQSCRTGMVELKKIARMLNKILHWEWRGSVAPLVRGHLGFAFVSGRARRPSPHKQNNSGAYCMIKRIFSAAVAVLVLGSAALAQPPQAARQQQAQPSS